MDHSSSAATSSIVALLSANQCRFLSSISQLVSFLEELRNVLKTSPSNLPCAVTEKKREDANAYACLKEVLQCVLSTLENINGNRDCSEISETENLLSTVETKSISDLFKYVCSFFIDPFLEAEPAGFKVPAKGAPIWNSLSPREKLNLLHYCIVELCKICEDSGMLREICINCISSSFLSALMQLCFSPSSARIFDIERRRECLRYLNSLTTLWISDVRLIEDTIILQGNFTKVAPIWLRKKCGVMLTKILLRENGIKTVINTVINSFYGSQPGDERGWERVIALSSLLSTLPSSGIDAESYCRLACLQLIDLLRIWRINSENSKDGVRIAVTTIHALHEKFPAESAVFEKIICEPLLQLTECCNGEDLDLLNLFECFEDCIENLHQICVSVGVVPDTLVMMLLKPYVKVFLSILVCIHGTSSHLVSFISDLFLSLLKNTDQGNAVDIILSSFAKNHDSSIFKPTRKGLQFTVGENGKFSINLQPCLDPSKTLNYLDVKVEVLFQIISKIEGLAGGVFLQLVKNICIPSKNIPLGTPSSKLLTPGERTAEALELNEERFITFGLLHTLIEGCDHSTLLNNSSQILDFVSITLSNVGTNKNDTNEDALETVKICTSVIGLCLLSEVDSTQKRRLTELVPELERISDLPTFLTAEMKSLISDLNIAISTYGAVNLSSTEDFSDVMKKYMQLLNLSQTDNEGGNSEKNNEIHAKNTEKDMPLPSVPSRKEFDSKSTSICADERNTCEPSEKSFREALNDVHSSSPALKGGSIRYLTKCINANVTAAMSQVKAMTEIFMDALNDGDSFVYLSAVQGLAVVANVADEHLRVDGVFDKILKNFIGQDLDSMHADPDHAIVSRMKLGEVITRVIKQMGDMAPHHASVLLPKFLTLARHEDPCLRASSLSNLAEIAPMALHMISSMEYEIKDCLCGICKTDKDLLVRRSAVYAIRRIIESLSDKVLTTFPNTIKEIYRTVKEMYAHDDDNTVQLHAQLTLEELDRIMRANLFKPPELSKKIVVLP